MKKWRKYNGALIPNTPPHIEVDLECIGKKIVEDGAYFARWTTNFDCNKETNFWYIINDTPMLIKDYSKNTRSKIRRGLKRCKVKLVNKEEIKKSGFLAYSKAFLRYKTNIYPKTYNEFKNEIDRLEGIWHFWAIYSSDNILIGYSQNRIFENYCDYSTVKFHPDYLTLYPSYALFFTMNNYYLNQQKFKYVNDGAKSMSHDTNIQNFLTQKFKFRKAYCKLHLQYRPVLRVIINILFPFRLMISKIQFGIFKKINVLLNHENIIRLDNLSIINKIEPIIIIGAARSGTHLIATSIQKNINCIYLNEINDLWKKKFVFIDSDEITLDIINTEKVNQTRKEFEKLLAKKPFKTYLLEKTASNCLRLDFVQRVFPNAKFIHIKRDGKSVSVSVRKKYFGNIYKISSEKMKARSSFLERFNVFISESKHKFENRISFLMLFSNSIRYLKMSLVILGIKKRDFWGPRFQGYKETFNQFSPLDLAVFQWKYCTHCLTLFLSKLEKSKYISISYEDLISNPEKEMSKVLDFIIGKRFNAKILHEIRNSGLMRWDESLSKNEIEFLKKEIDDN
ncbi:MAG: hypothetical protein CMD16_02755 [Flavobacteriales bacterium]|nr:hypothetical protein [Flavobacteriales bacterium]|tara:strand:+ start:59449 stop:61146 length:1698 start_codon:yes stop_codon:yes gene_type:complete